MIEAIKEFMASPEMKALIASVGSLLIANLGTIITFACKYLKLKGKELKMQETYDKVTEELTAHYEAKIEEFASHIDNTLSNVESVVIKKVKDKEEALKEEIKQETISIEEAIKATKESLKLDE